MHTFDKIKDFLENSYEKVCSQDFISSDPISIPHLFTLKQDIEISGLIASIFAFGKRVILIKKVKEVINLMDHSPYDFVKNAGEKDFVKFGGFKHRTLDSSDLIYILKFLQDFYKVNSSLETLFSKSVASYDHNIENALIKAHDMIFQGQQNNFRTRKHFPSPIKGSSCKRINMFMRWMVRKDKHNIDFGIWNNIQSSQLICPCDVHVINVAHNLGLISQKKSSWKIALELTNNLKLFNNLDPLKYDIALFGAGINKIM